MELLDFILHFDDYLVRAISEIGAGTYVLLFLIVFAETGLVITPFLPGDSLLFAAGTLASRGLLDVWVVMASLVAAAILGDTVNYWAGSKISVKVFARENPRFLKASHLQKTQAFYAKHGAKTIVIARFVPIVRTFAPFVAGVGKMRYARFFVYNVFGALVWVMGLTLGGFFLGSLPMVKKNFELAILAIIALSILPGVVAFIRHRKSSPDAIDVSYEKVQEIFHE